MYVYIYIMNTLSVSFTRIDWMTVERKIFICTYFINLSALLHDWNLPSVYFQKLSEGNMDLYQFGNDCVHICQCGIFHHSQPHRGAQCISRRCGRFDSPVRDLLHYILTFTRTLWLKDFIILAGLLENMVFMGKRPLKVSFSALQGNGLLGLNI